MPKPKNCSRCEVEQTEENSTARTGNKYWNTYCRDCRTIVTREYNRNRPAWSKAKQRRTHIKWAYGIDAGPYQAMIDAGCFVCGSMENLCVDHDHSCCPGKRSCGKCIRGVLCHRHNLALGWVNDSIEELQRLVEYLASED